MLKRLGLSFLFNCIAYLTAKLLIVNVFPNFSKILLKYYQSISNSYECVFFLLSFAIISIIYEGIIRIKLYKDFKQSYGLLKKELIPKMEDKVQKNKYEDNNKIDRYIQPPIEYVNETVKGNQVPAFEPDKPYHEEIFDPNIDYIVAITAENPNLWLDPTMCFYMANCYAVSLIRHANGLASKYKMVIKHYKDFKKEYRTERDAVLQKLKEGKKPDVFQFVRFFLYDKEQSECCNSAVFPSLKATQDLFRTLPFFIFKDNFQKDTDTWNSFKEIVNSIWDLFGEETKSKVLKKRKEKTIPEFLVLFYKDEHIEIHTYLDGGHRKIDNVKESVNYVGEEGEKSLNKINELISYMAQYIQKKNDDFMKDLVEEKKNLQNTFIDWISFDDGDGVDLSP